MAKLLNKMLNLVGWEDEEEILEEEEETEKDYLEQPQFPSNTYNSTFAKRPSGKVVNIHSTSQFKLMVMQPGAFDDAQEICDHLKNKKPVIVNLEGVEKELAQRIIDFLSGSVYSLDGSIQKVATGIFVIAPHNVDIMGDFKDELKNKGVFPWIK
jgi:cell division inhibitor SepF